ncbi:helix-turn-helix transcriptional regulator [uncultured Streptomyces sp.]|uniref:helix-turn-helix transcriptional regulator n=1 Tax=uncultured Streptomyces sp. TaxID=174707 RepID=UPI00262344D5|nr:helix-turn-helix domain-containing protein [uncultured Streptomyces sp.]
MSESSGPAEVPGGAADARRSLADKLNHLFETRKNPATGKRYTNAEVARVISVSESAISQLRTGAKPNPTLKTVERLAGHFHVEAQYFFSDYDADEAEKVRASMELIEAVADSEVRGLALRANGLSADSLKMITNVINQARRWEGLDRPGQ